ncbi:hypothetical protein [Cohnella sp. CFH 77786]|nr:hypothetical protein [Cohnella sp. CFH 77786]
MNRECENNQLSREPIQAAGIVHAGMADGRSLSIFTHTVIPIAK